MSLENEQERINTQIKLARLVKRREALAAQLGGDEELRALSMESLRGTIRQLQEEIARYEAHCGRSGETPRVAPNPAGP